MIRLYGVLLICGYHQCLITIHIPMNFHYTVHFTTAYLTRHILSFQLQIHIVSLTDLVYCVDIANKVSVLYLVPVTVNNVQIYYIYLFLIVPIAIAGLVLVLLLFILNLTVTDGTINAFILYVNIVSINTPVFFPQLGDLELTPAYTFISLANLDLGIQTCFYNGMDDYAKMWLQLAFPFYLIFIATSLIITSRYSTTVQRLTPRRALPVLATLFLLSYTKIGSYGIDSLILLLQNNLPTR